MKNKSLAVKKILIANRGEISRRIQVTAHAFGIQTVAVYTKEDKNLSYVYSAHEAYELSDSASAGYLNQEELIAIAKRSNTDAVHPGYGFLSENSEFAQRVIDANLTWIGPTPQQIKLLADKSLAQKTMRAAGVPVIPGEVFDAQDNMSNIKAYQRALAISFPVLIKCAHGGGGKAMRTATTPKDFATAWDTVVSEAKRFFSSSTILIEKQIIIPKHIEVQIAGDGKKYIHLYERECSLQRRHQKIIEEAPASFINQVVKNKLYDAALKAAQAVAYENIGTVEFLVDQEDNIYFLEMNTRLQVEHSVTEATTNIDLVYLQICIAKNKKLPYSQEQIVQHGHAIECRLYAENPQQNFAPSAGTITNLVFPNEPFVRIDHDLEDASEITPFFDPMLAKITTWAKTRKEAIVRMFSALEKSDVSGICTNKLFLQQLLSSQEFIAGTIHTQSLENKAYLEKLLSTVIAPHKAPLVLTKEQKVKLAQKIKALLNTESQKQETNKDQKSMKRVSRWKIKQWE